MGYELIFRFIKRLVIYFIIFLIVTIPIGMFILLYIKQPKYYTILAVTAYICSIYSIYKIFRKNIFKSLLFTNIAFYLSLLIFSTVLNVLHKTGLNKDIINIVISIPAGIFYLVFIFYGIISFLVKKIRNTSKNNDTKVSQKETYINNPEIFIFNKGDIQLTNPFRGIYIQGGAGSGKSKSLIEPIITQSVKNRFSGVLYDFKSPELIEYAYTCFNPEKTDVRPYILDFKEPVKSHRCNPINPYLMNNSAYAFEYSEVILNNLMPETIKKKDFFVRSARSILAGIIWWLKQELPEYCTLPHAISLILHTDSENLIKTLSQNYEVGGMVSSIKEAMERGAERQVSAVLGTLKDSITLLNTPDIFWLLSGNDFTLDLNNILEPKFLMIGNDSTLSDTFAPVISLTISVAVRLMNRPDKQRSIIILDEAPTLYIPRIEQIPATSRSNKLITVFGAQDYSQIIDRYGEDKASVLVSNLGNQFYGRSTNTKTAENISKLFSKTDKTFTQKSKGTGTSGRFIHLDSNNNKNFSESIQERDRVKISDIINMEVGHFYGLIAEGSHKELLNKKFEVLLNTSPTKENDLTTATDTQIKENYIKIIEEAKSLISLKS